MRFIYGVVSIFTACSLAGQPLFDTHLHYSVETAEQFPPRAILAQLDRHAIAYAVVTSTPPEHVSSLYSLAPNRIVPILGVYRHYTDKTTWIEDTTIPPRLEKQLQRGFWRGIGELHLFAEDRNSNVFQQIITLANDRKIPLLLHCDPAVIDRLYEIAPDQKVIWAHAGTYPYPDLLADYLHRYPNLLIDVSMRDDRIAPDGIIRDEWYDLFVTYPDRVMIGVDTFSTYRWQQFGSAIRTIRHWLAQLPDDVAAQLAFTNAATLFQKSLHVEGEQ